MVLDGEDPFVARVREAAQHLLGIGHGVGVDVGVHRVRDAEGLAPLGFVEEVAKVVEVPVGRRVHRVPDGLEVFGHVVPAPVVLGTDFHAEVAADPGVLTVGRHDAVEGLGRHRVPAGAAEVDAYRLRAELRGGLDDVEHPPAVGGALIRVVHPDVRAVDAEVRERQFVSFERAAHLVDEIVLEGWEEARPNVRVPHVVAEAEHVEIAEDVAFAAAE